MVTRNSFSPREHLLDTVARTLLGISLSCGALPLGSAPALADPRPAVAVDFRQPQVIGLANDQLRVPIARSVNPIVRRSVDVGPVAGNMMFEHVILVLRRAPQASVELEALQRRQQTPTSPDYQRWLQPGQIGRMFGPAEADLQSIAAWLRQQGMTVNGVAASGMSIDFSGSADGLKSAFGADIHRIKHDGESHVVNIAPLSVPASFAKAISGVAELDDMRKGSFLAPARVKSDAGTGSGSSTLDLVGPQDFATIYNLHGLWSSGVVGQGRTIAIVGRSEVVQTDVAAFDRHFAVARNSPVQAIRHSAATCRDPGYAYSGDEVEATLDAEWSGAVAPGARIVMAACASTAATDGVDLAARQAVELDPDVISVSFGACEQNLSAAEQAYFYDLWQQAAVQGTTVVVAAGDSGAEACSPLGDVYDASQGAAVSALASTPFNVAVGGTDFQDRVQAKQGPGARNTQYWKNKNGAGGLSALSYVPEMTWNDTCATPFLFSFEQLYRLPGLKWQVFFQCGSIFSSSAALLGGGGGGFSQLYTQPAWQLPVYGMPPVGARQMPDVSLFSADGVFGHALFFCNQSLLGTCTWDTNSQDLAGGTSFAAPAFAGIIALVDGKMDQRQGNANYRLYQLGMQEFGAQSSPPRPGLNACNASRGNKVGKSCVFHSVTIGNIRQGCWTERHYYDDSNLNDAVQCYYGGESYTFDKTLLGYGWSGIMSLSNNKLRFDPGYFDAALGYSVATGLGSPDVGNLVSAW